MNQSAKEGPWRDVSEPSPRDLPVQRDEEIDDTSQASEFACTTEVRRKPAGFIELLRQLLEGTAR